MNFCPHCGARAMAGSKFCAECGKPLLAPSAPDVPEPRGNATEAEPALPSTESHNTQRSFAVVPRTRDERREDFVGFILVVVGLLIFLYFYAVNRSAVATFYLGLGTLIAGLALSPTFRDFFAKVRQGVKDQREEGLCKATEDWSKAFLMKSYNSGSGGMKEAESDANILARHGYSVAAQSGAGSHVNVGRTVTPAVLTGGLSLLFGASRTKGTVQVTFTKVG